MPRLKLADESIHCHPENRKYKAYRNDEDRATAVGNEQGKFGETFADASTRRRTAAAECYLLDGLVLARVDLELGVERHVEQADLRRHQIGHGDVHQLIVTDVEHLQQHSSR